MKFSDFSNKNRIKFLKIIIQQRTSPELAFADLKELGMRPAEDLSLPENIKWMEEHFKAMDFRGNKMHASVFLKDESIHEYLEVYSMQAVASFSYVDCEGECEIVCEFPDLIAKQRRDAELIVSVDKVRLDKADDSVRVSNIKERILEVINRDKLSAYRDLAATNA
ncbi:hypothetical protein [Rhizobium sp. BG4]|uniref:hypothetical protein n=1 Tax=Rhizobium sp. BG4 TaxID=2613770 RepID=UPI00193E30F4|nr:hypothetical protein [Rhizobium sp. BG4]QRM45210.1 hypothetical protein F2982_18305 [Rhizobium sp. BG4]